tara:strand:+ start:3038 stop:3556 length:519 start_codon:yes stop_codon:yes gene_type:complete
MARGVSTRAVKEYVLESDRGLPLDEQTIFHVSPRTARTDAKTLQRYDRATQEKRGRRLIDSEKWSAADTAEFLSFCVKVENFVFDPATVEDSPVIENYLVKDGKTFAETEDGGLRSGVIEDAIGRTLVLDSLQSEHYLELVEVSKSLTRLREGESAKKVMSSPRTSRKSGVA